MTSPRKAPGSYGSQKDYKANWPTVGEANAPGDNQGLAQTRSLSGEPA